MIKINNYMKCLLKVYYRLISNLNNLILLKNQKPPIMDQPNYTYKAKIISVYDGDTITALVDLGFRINFEIKIRLLGIDTPELRGASRPEGLIAKKRVEELILGKEIILKTQRDKQEKYGRWLGEIYIPGEELSVNQRLVNEGLAVPFM
jgi:micrococcal nuclease